MASLLALETLSDTEDIKMYINSPGAHPLLHFHAQQCAPLPLPVRVTLFQCEMCAGGQAYSIISILDTMEVIKPDIATIAFGQCASTATLLLVRAL